MNDADYARQCVLLLRPRAKFVAQKHSSEFIAPTANLGNGFHYVSLYDEQIDSNVIKTPRGLILIHNTYLPSFAYNLFLCWMLCAGQGSESVEGQDDEQGTASAVPDPDEAPPSPALPDLSLLLKHNFKKFFAEQLLHLRNSIFSRAVLLETLLFEQKCMIPVFALKNRDPEVASKASLGSQLMSSLVSCHELAHFFADHNPHEWEYVRQNSGGNLAALDEHVRAVYPAAFAEEFKCDAMAVVSCLRLYEDKMPRAFCLQAIVFAFAAFATLSSLTKSARQTSLDHRGIEEFVDFASIEKQQRNYDYAVGIDQDLAERSRLVKAFCEGLAQEEGLDLYDARGSLPITPAILAHLLAYVDQVMENPDTNARTMSMLAAEALHGHPQGIEYLYLRSKTFDLPSGE